MGTPDAEPELPTSVPPVFSRKMQWVLVPVAMALSIMLLALFATGNPLAPFAFVGLIVISIAFNGYVVVTNNRRRSTRAPSRGGADVPMVRDQHTGRFVPATVGQPLPQRFLRGLRSIIVSSRFEATVAAAREDAQAQLYAACQAVGAQTTWYPSANGIVVEWKVRPPNIRNDVHLTATGELRQTDAGTVLTGHISPNAQSKMSIIHVVIFGVGGCIALVFCLFGLLFSPGDKFGLLFGLVWGTFGSLFVAGWVWSHASAFEVHEQILTSVFDQVTFDRS